MTVNAAAFTVGMVAAAVGVTWWATRPYAPRVVPQWRAWIA